MKLRHRLTATILLIAFATTSALPAAGIPNIKAPATIKTASAPPRVALPPRVVAPPKPPVIKTLVVPKVPNVPVVKAPVVPKVPAVVRVPAVKTPVAPKISAIKTPVTPRIVKAPAPAKAPAIKVPAVVSAPKAPSVVKAPVTIKALAQPVIVKAPVSVKPAPVLSSGKTSSANGEGNTLASVTSAPPPDTRATVQGGNGNAQDNDDDAKKDKKGRDFSNINEAYRRQQQSEDADDDSHDPYFKNGVFDRDQFQKDERLVADYYNDQVGAQDLLDSAKKPGGQDEGSGGNTPVSVTRGRIKDLVKVEEASQTTGLNGDEKEVVDAKDAIARGKVKDPKAVNRLVDSVANKGVDNQYGEAPEVDVKDLERKGDELRRKGKYREAIDFYEQAKDALRNGGKNSAAYRLTVIAEVQEGIRPAKDLNRVVKPGSIAGKGTGTGAGTGSSPVASPGSTPATAPAAGNEASATAQVGQNVADAVANRPGKAKDTTSTTPAAGGAGSATAGQNAAAGQQADTGVQNSAQQGTSAGVTNQLGADTQNLGANSAANPAADTPSNNNDRPGNNESPAASNPDASVSTPQDEVVLSTPGNDTDFVHTQSADGNTAADINYHADGTFTGTVTTVTRDADGNITSTTTQTVSGTYTEGDDGERHHTVTDASSPASSGTSQGQSQDGTSDGDKDDKDDDSSTSPPSTTESESTPAETAETEDDTAEASTEGTPNPEARDRNGYTGRLADQTGGRLGGDEQRRQNGAINQRKNGNGAGGPNPEGNTSSGVLLTKEEQSTFAKNLGMKRGGGVITPTENETSTAVTDRDLKDIAARRGSTINPAGDKGGKDGSGQALGKKGFTPGAPAPTPAPRGVQVNNAVLAAPAASAVNGSAIRVDSAKVKAAAR